MHFTLNKKRWRFERALIRRKQDGHRVYGECSRPDEPHRVVIIDSRIKDELELNVILHELLHAAAWDVLDEDFVDSTATGIARLLYRRLGYRKTPESV